MNGVYAPADDTADGKMYLALAEDIENIIARLKIEYKANCDMGIYYRIQGLRNIQREHRKTAMHLLYRGERRRKQDKEGL